MNTNTYRCGCGRILGYLPSGAKESCTACLQVRRQEAIAKAGARGTHERYFDGTVYHASCTSRRKADLDMGWTYPAFIKAPAYWPETPPPSPPEHPNCRCAPLTPADFSEPLGPEHDDRLKEARYAMQAWRDAARTHRPGQAPGKPWRAQVSPSLFSTGAELDQYAKAFVGLDRKPGESDLSLRTRLLTAQVAGLTTAPA